MRTALTHMRGPATDALALVLLVFLVLYVTLTAWHGLMNLTTDPVGVVWALLGHHHHTAVLFR